MGASKSKPLSPEVKDLEELDPEEFESFKEAFNNGGLSELKRKVDEDIDKWKNVPVNIAVTGNSGNGKSSFINSFRGLKAYSEGAAKVGVDETTFEPKDYMHPINKNIVLWDLPGVGTQNFPKNTYLQAVDFHKYEYFLIITATRFTENDIWLANEVQNLGKKFIFIRTKMSIDVSNDGHDNPGICKDDTVSKVRQAMAKHVKDAGFEEIRVFLIDNHFPLDYDFPDLIETMINEAPKWKQEAMTLTMTNLTKSLIHRKKDVLQKRIMKVAIVSAIGGAVPLPGVGLVVDLSIFIEEIHFYRKQLGLDDDSLQEIARSLDTTVEHLKVDLQLNSHFLGASLRSIAAFVSTLVLSEVAETVSAIAIPILGSFVGANISYGSTVAVLRSILDALVSDALAINKRLMQQLSEQSFS
ncbi:interferon-inducible GTPase 5-like [Ruditapes philippinarum]|uniref:interferon-inducible GTPase 5-like n=1 Tax=Ruditapes philippinarum TaxID=129788 RepID=UPI00295B2008|nr:interferon-inducible GTPase 5-like [Ruditapes philippinarum]